MRESGGYSLVELTIVVAFLGFIAAVVIPAANPFQEQKLDSAANEFANAIRFTRDEAIRAGQYRAVIIDTTSGLVTVGTPNIAGGEVAGLSATAYNPADKRPYSFNVTTGNSGVRFDTTAQPFTFRSVAGARNTCLFDTLGNPLMLTTGKTYGLTSAAARLVSGVDARTVTVSLVGRVDVN